MEFLKLIKHRDAYKMCIAISGHDTLHLAPYTLHLTPYRLFFSFFFFDADNIYLFFCFRITKKSTFATQKSKRRM
jgi:hypothetical protein